MTGRGMVWTAWVALAAATACGGSDAFQPFELPDFSTQADLVPPGVDQSGVGASDLRRDLSGSADAQPPDDLATALDLPVLGGDLAQEAPIDFAKPPPPDLATPDLAAPKDLPVDASAMFDAGGSDLAKDPAVANPNGIKLVEITTAAFGAIIQGGRSDDNIFGIGTGAAVGDLDGDGRLDLVLARNDDPFSDKPGGPSLLLLNDTQKGQSPHFTADAPFTKLLSGVHAHGVALGDYDRDGDLDIYITAEKRNHLLQNDGKGHFTDVTDAAGVGGNAIMGASAVFADLNRDGLLDLYAVNFNQMPGSISEKARNRLYINMGDGTFAEASKFAGVDDVGASHTAAAIDLDGDGRLALYVSNDRFASDGSMSDPNLPADSVFELTGIDDAGLPHYANRNAARGVVAWRSGMGVAVADVDGDLTPDLWVSDIGRKALYLNKVVGGQLVEAAAAYKLAARADDAGHLLITWGASFLDLDRDRHLELLLANGFFGTPMNCEVFFEVPWFLRQPAPDAPYDRITDLVGIQFPLPQCPGPLPADQDHATTRAVVTGDLDGDGDDDIVLTSYGAPYFVYRNDTPMKNHAVRLRLAGTVSSPDPIGASLVVTHLDGKRSATFRVAGGLVQSQSDGVLTLGLGAAQTVTRAEVRWPSGVVQRIDQLPGFGVDKVVKVAEPAWLTVEPRVAGAQDTAPVFTYRPVDEAGAPLGVKGSGRTVIVQRGDGVKVTVADDGKGTYTASLPHPGSKRRTSLVITVDGVLQRPRPTVLYR